MAELKPCPFCGGLPYLFEKEVEFPHYIGTAYTIKCDRCFASVADIDREVAEAKWNRRAENG